MFSDPADDPLDPMYDEMTFGPLTEEDAYWAYMPCQGCGGEMKCKPDCPKQAYNAYLEERINRLGVELAMLPDWMECYDCGREHLMVMTSKCGIKYVLRRPVGLGPIVDAHRDPTQMYRLECGHLTM